MRKGGRHEIESTHQPRFQMDAKVRFGSLIKGQVRRKTVCVVDESMEPAKSRHGFGDCPFCSVGIGDAALDDTDLCSRGLDERVCFLEWRAGPADDDDIRTFLCQRDRYPLTYARAGAGDDNGTTRELVRNSSVVQCGHVVSP